MKKQIKSNQNRMKSMKNWKKLKKNRIKSNFNVDKKRSKQLWFRRKAQPNSFVCRIPLNDCDHFGCLCISAFRKYVQECSVYFVSSFLHFYVLPFSLVQFMSPVWNCNLPFGLILDQLMDSLIQKYPYI